MNTFIKPPHASIWLSTEAISLSTKLMVQRELNEGLALNRYTLTNLETKFLAIMNHYEIPYSL